MSVYLDLLQVQADLKAPKGQTNNFGKYKYRSCEDILEAVKPLLAKNELTLTLTDSIELIGERYYIKATATISGVGDEGDSISVNAYARECETKKGMDDAQLTGSCSSYARKYALNGLFLIDDTKDADTMDNTKPLYTTGEEQVFNGLFINDEPLGFYCFIQRIGPDAYTELYNSFPKDKVKNKARCDELEKQGNANATEIAESVTDMVANDDPAYAEDLDGLRDYEKKVVAGRMSKETLEKIKQMKGASNGG